MHTLQSSAANGAALRKQRGWGGDEGAKTQQMQTAATKPSSTTLPTAGSRAAPGVTSHKLQVTIYKSQVTSYKSQVTSHKSQVTSYCDEQPNSTLLCQKAVANSLARSELNLRTLQQLFGQDMGPMQGGESQPTQSGSRLGRGSQTR